MIANPVLPPGVSKALFAKALAEYRAIVSDEHVIVDLDRLAPYTRLMLPEDERLHQPCGSVSAASLEQIQKILAVSNRYRIPLWTISTGRNFGYGEAAPATPGQMVLDLRRMNRIIEVDAELGTALVEPGVTYRQLQDYLTEHNLPFWFNHPSPAPIVGPVGNTLERGMGYTRYQEQAQHFCGMEVVLADGSVVRTAMGGAENSRSWQAYRWGYGPWIDGLFCQSNLGIVTKLGMWLMRKPAAHKTWAAGFNDVAGACRAMEVLRDLKLDNVIETGLTVHVSYGVAMKARREQLYQGPGAVPDAVWEGFCTQTGAPLWSSVGTLYGQPEQIEVNLRIVRDAFTRIGGQVFTEDNATGGAMILLNNVRGLMTNELSLEDFGIFNYRGGGCSWLAPVVPMRATDVMRSFEVTKATYEEFGFDYIGGFMMGFSGRHCDAATVLLFDRSNPEELQRAHACYAKLIDVNAKAGYPPYRASTAFMQRTADIYGPAQRAINLRLKQALDPNGILAPGKSGIGSA